MCVSSDVINLKMKENEIEVKSGGGMNVLKVRDLTDDTVVCSVCLCVVCVVCVCMY